VKWSKKKLVRTRMKMLAKLAKMLMRENDHQRQQRTLQ
jgi:hypothetical protein